jgi:cytoskeletal protein RodZ
MSKNKTTNNKSDGKPNSEKKEKSTMQKVVDKVNNMLSSDKPKDEIVTPAVGEGILPVGEDAPPVKETSKPPEETKTSKFFSDKVYTVERDVVLFVGCIHAQKGLNIQRIEEKKFRLFGTEIPEGKTERENFAYIFPDDLTDEDKVLIPPSFETIFQKELDDYEQSKIEEAKAEKLAPVAKPKEGVDAPPALNPVVAPVVYATSGVKDMEDYGELIYNQLMSSPVVKFRNDKFTAIEVENNLKKESTLYNFALKYDQKQRGWYIDITQGRNVVRVPKDKALFLPIK